MFMPRVEFYCNNRPNAVRVDLEDRTLWFSYNTLIAFQIGDNSRVVSENCWGPTTGKHLNALGGDLSGKKYRVSRAEFERLYQEQSEAVVKVS